MRILTIILLAIFFCSFRFQHAFSQPTNWGATTLYASAETLPSKGNEASKLHYVIADNEIRISASQSNIMILDDGKTQENTVHFVESELEEGTLLRIYNGDDDNIYLGALTLKPNSENHVLYLMGKWNEAYQTETGWEILN